MPQERLQKIISSAGIASRRAAEELITGGHVQVNGKTITELGAKADSATDEVRVNGTVVQIPRHHMYLVMNKPKGYVTTVSDPEGRQTVMDLLPPDCPRVYPVGRLDYLTEGLLIFTNDGDLAYKLMHASSHVPKTYLVKVSGEPTEEDIERLRTGVRIARNRDLTRGGHVKTAPAQIRWVRHADNPWLEVTLVEGRNRQIRKMFEEIGHHIEKIRRIRYGPLELDVEPGALRSLKMREVTELKMAAGLLKQREPAAKESSARAPRAEGTGERTAERPASGFKRRGPQRETRGSERGERPPKKFRPAASGERRERPAFGERRERPSGSGERRERPAFGDRRERPSDSPARRERPAAFGQRSDRPAFGERRERPVRSGEARERPAFGTRRERPAAGERRERPSSGPRGERPAFGERRERPASSGERRERPAFGARRERPSSGPRGERPSSGPRGDRPARSGERRERPAFGARRERPSSGPRGERPSSGPRGDRPARSGERRERPAFGARRERPTSGDRRERPSSAPRRERPSRSGERPGGSRPRRERPDGDRPDRFRRS